MFLFIYEYLYCVILTFTYLFWRIERENVGASRTERYFYRHHYFLLMKVKRWKFRDKANLTAAPDKPLQRTNATELLNQRRERREWKHKPVPVTRSMINNCCRERNSSENSVLFNRFDNILILNIFSLIININKKYINKYLYCP